MAAKDSLGDRMKSYYEDRTRYYLPNKSYVIMRIDGKAFHTFTKKMKRPFDLDFIEDMNQTAIELCKNIIGAKFAYVQSDEISILISDLDDIYSQSWFENNIQKMTSVSASIATCAFNESMIKRVLKVCENIKQPDEYFINFNDFKMAQFDSRVFTIPTLNEVMNYFLWRQQDCTRNSIAMVAQSLYSTKELHKVNTTEMQEYIFRKGINWNDYDPKLKRGRFIEKVVTVNGQEAEIQTDEFDSKVYVLKGENDCVGLTKEDKVRSAWEIKECPIFSKDWDFLKSRIPVN